MEICPKCQNPLHSPLQGDGISCPHCAMTNLLGGDEEPEYQDPANYEIEEEIGRGGDGVVYRCRDKNVGRLVAIKFVNFLRTADDTTSQRFRSEIETIASLDHPHIIPVYTNGEMGGRAFYTMKYLGGGSLASRHEHPMPPDEAVAMMKKLVDAVSHAHQRGVLHRDLKPSNVLLDDRGEPCLSDFGLAKRDTSDSQLTLTGSVMGTPAYMSPEQARGENTDLTPSSDIFSLGSLFFFLLTGQHAFQGDDSHIILRRVIDNEPTFPELDRDLVAVCRKCLEKNPALRYPSAQDLLEDLDHWQNDEPVTARHLTVTRRAGRFVRRHSHAVIACSFAILAAALWFRPAPSSPAPNATPVENEADYLSRVEQSLTKLRQLDYHEANRLLENAPSSHRDLEWHIAKALARGDEIWRIDHSDLSPSNLFLSQGKVILTSSQGESFLVSPKDGSLKKTNPIVPPDQTTSPDQTWIAKVDGGTVSLHQTKDPVPTFQFEELPTPVSARFSTDSQFLITSSSSERSSFQVIDLNSGKPTISQTVAAFARASPNFDNSAMTLFGDFPYFISWDYRAENNMRQFGLFPDKPHFRRETYRGDGSYLFGHFSTTSHLVSLPDGSGAISLHPDGILRRWPPLRALPGIDDSLTVDVGEGPPAISQNARYALFRNFHQQPEIHDFETGNSFLLPFVQSPVLVLNNGTFISLVEQTGQLITRRYDGIEESAWLWNADTTMPGKTDQRLIQTAVTPDEKFAVALFSSGFLKFNLEQREVTFTATPEIPSSITISPDGSKVVVTTRDSTLHEGSSTTIIPSQKTQHRHCRFLNNKELLIADNKGNLLTYPLHDLENPTSLQLERITALTTSQDGRFILTGGNERIILWRDSQKRLEIPTDSSPFWLQLCDNDRILVHLNQRGTIERLILNSP